MITLSQSQNVEAFTQIVRENQAGLRAYVRSLGVDEIWVDDIAQEVFLVAYRRQSDFKADSDYGKWLRGIARHLVANERRKDARRSRLMHAGLADLLMQASLSDEVQEPDLTHLTSILEICVEQLAPHSRELLNQRYANGEHASALALQFHTSAEAVRQNLRRIRLLVKHCVERKLQEAAQ